MTWLHWDLIGWGGHWSGGSSGPVIQVIQVIQVVQLVQVIRSISIDDMHSENIWFSWSKSSNYREKLRCHACDRRTDGGGKWKIEQCSGRTETAKSLKMQKFEISGQIAPRKKNMLQKIVPSLSTLHKPCFFQLYY